MNKISNYNSHFNFNIKAFIIILISIILIILAIIYIKNTFNPAKESNPVVDVYQDQSNNNVTNNNTNDGSIKSNNVKLTDDQKKAYASYLTSYCFLNSFNIIANDINQSEYALSQNQDYIISYAIKWSMEYDNQKYVKNIVKYSENKYRVNYNYLKSLINDLFAADLTTMINPLNAVNGILYYTSNQNAEVEQLDYTLNFSNLSFDQASSNYLLYFNKTDKNNKIEKKYIFGFHVENINNIKEIKPNYIKLQ